MKPERILVPIDTARCPIEVFARINAFAARPGVTIILLHVVNLNLAAMDRRIEEELCKDAQRHLERLAAKYVHSEASIVVRVRTGRPVAEILAEAEAQNADLMILGTSESWQQKARPPLRWLTAAVFPGVVGKLVRLALCPLLIVHAQTFFDCEKQWGRTTRESQTEGSLHSATVLSGG